MPVNETNWIRLFGERLRGESEDLMPDELPRRWVDLIHFLDEREQKRDAQRSEGGCPDGRPKH
jgi:hypothetical protein